MIRSGPMRHRIDIQVRDTSPDASGEQSDVWALYTSRWAEILPMLGGAEIVASQQRQGRVPTRFKVRYFPGVVPQMRIVPTTGPHRGRWFDITEVLVPNSIPYEMVLVAEELVEMPL